MKGKGLQAKKKKDTPIKSPDGDSPGNAQTPIGL